MSFFDNKSGQHMGDGAQGIQVAGDATFGNTTTEIVTICELVVRSQMASLKEDAYKIVNQRATEFGNQIAEKLSQDFDDKLKERLADPDVQYSINQAVTQVARKGFNEKSELLKELIVTKIHNNDEEDDLLIDHALEITQKLTTNDIKFLSLIYYLRSIAKIKDGINITRLAEKNQTHPDLVGFTVEQNHLTHKDLYSNHHPDYVRILGDLNTIKAVNDGLLAVKGVVYSDKFYTITYQELLGKRIGVESFLNEDEFFEKFPALKAILNAYNIDTLKSFNSITLNPIGDIVAENYLKARHFIS